MSQYIGKDLGGVPVAWGGVMNINILKRKPTLIYYFIVDNVIKESSHIFDQMAP